MTNGDLIKGPGDIVAYARGKGHNVFALKERLVVALIRGGDGEISAIGIEELSKESPDSVAAFVKRFGGDGYATIISRPDDTPDREVIGSDLISRYRTVDSAVNERFGIAPLDFVVVGSFEGFLYSFKNKEFYPLFTPRVAAVA